MDCSMMQAIRLFKLSNPTYVCLQCFMQRGSPLLPSLPSPLSDEVEASTCQVVNPQLYNMKISVRDETEPEMSSRFVALIMYGIHN